MPEAAEGPGGLEATVALGGRGRASYESDGASGAALRRLREKTGGMGPYPPSGGGFRERVERVLKLSKY